MLTQPGRYPLVGMEGMSDRLDPSSYSEILDEAGNAEHCVGSSLQADPYLGDKAGNFMLDTATGTQIECSHIYLHRQGRHVQSLSSS